MKLYSDAELAQLLDQPIFHTISAVADEMGVECYVVGGYVRDIFLERPSNDIDVVVVGSGIAVAQALKQRLGKKAILSVFRNFGTAQIKAPSNLPPLGEASNSHKKDLVETEGAKASPRGGRLEGASPIEKLEGARPQYQTATPVSYDILRGNAESHRAYPTEAEKAMWEILRGKNIGFKFRRQHVIADFIVDFVCLKLQLVIEIDGKYHLTSEQKEADEWRTSILNRLGYSVLRFTNEDVLHHPEKVLKKIKEFSLTINSVSSKAGAPSNLPPLGEASDSHEKGLSAQGMKASPSGGRLEGAPLEIEFVGARRESYSHDSRKPIVEDGTLEDDQNRRDFTINAMAICLNKKRFGELVDPFGGLDDLEDGIIRTPLDPDVTFSDDPLRMLRCIRFAAQLNFMIEEETFDALERNAERLHIISGERIADELNKIMMTAIPSKDLYDLYRCGLLQIILPELCQLDLVETRNGRAHKNNFYHTLEVLDNVAKASSNLYLRWAALLHDIGKPKSKRWDNLAGWTFHNHNFIGAKMVPGIFRRLKLPMDAKMKYVQKLVDLHMRPIAIADDGVTDSAVRRLLNDAGDDIDDLMTLCEADITSKNSQRKAQFRENFRIVREKLADLKEKDYKRLLQPCINGNEIMEMFHLSPGIEVGALKQCLKDAVLDNRVPNEREALMELLKKKAKQMGLDAK